MLSSWACIKKIHINQEVNKRLKFCYLETREDRYGFYCKYHLPQRYFPGSVGNVWKHVKL